MLRERCFQYPLSGRFSVKYDGTFSTVVSGPHFSSLRKATWTREQLPLLPPLLTEPLGLGPAEPTVFPEPEVLAQEGPGVWLTVRQPGLLLGPASLLPVPHPRRPQAEEQAHWRMGLHTVIVTLI